MLKTLAVAWAAAFTTALAVAQEPLESPRKQPPVDKNVPAAPQAQPQARRTSGRLFVKENRWDFGHVAQDAQVIHRFIVENIGDDTLYVDRIQPT